MIQPTTFSRITRIAMEDEATGTPPTRTDIQSQTSSKPCPTRPWPSTGASATDDAVFDAIFRSLSLSLTHAYALARSHTHTRTHTRHSTQAHRPSVELPRHDSSFDRTVYFYGESPRPAWRHGRRRDQVGAVVARRRLPSAFPTAGPQPVAAWRLIDRPWHSPAAGRRCGWCPARSILFVRATLGVVGRLQRAAPIAARRRLSFRGARCVPRRRRRAPAAAALARRGAFRPRGGRPWA